MHFKRSMLSKISVALGQSLTERELANVIKHIHEVVVPGVIGELQISFTDVASWFISQDKKWILPSKGTFPTVQTQWYPSRLSTALSNSAQMVETGAAADTGLAAAAAAPSPFNPAKWLEETDAAVVDRLHMILLELDKEVNPYSDALEETRKLGDHVYDLFKQKFLAVFAGTPLEGKISPTMVLKLKGNSIVTEITLLTAAILDPKGNRIKSLKGKDIRYSPDAIFINDSAGLIALKATMEQKISGMENTRAVALPPLPILLSLGHLFDVTDDYLWGETCFTLEELMEEYERAERVSRARIRSEEAIRAFKKVWSTWDKILPGTPEEAEVVDAAIKAAETADAATKAHRDALEKSGRFTDPLQMMDGFMSWADFGLLQEQMSPTVALCRKMCTAALQNERQLEVGVFYRASSCAAAVVNAITAAEEQGEKFFLAAAQAAHQTACCASPSLDDAHFYAVVLAAVWNRPRMPIQKPLTEARIEDVRKFLISIVNPVKSTLRGLFAARQSAALGARSALKKAEEHLCEVQSKAKQVAARADSSKKEGDRKAVARYADLVAAAKMAKVLAEDRVKDTALDVIEAKGLISPAFITAAIVSQTIAHIMHKETLESSVAWGGGRPVESAVDLEEVMTEQAAEEALSLAQQALQNTEAAAALAAITKAAAESERLALERQAYHAARKAADPSYGHQMTRQTRPLRQEETKDGIKAAMAIRSSPPQPAAAGAGGGVPTLVYPISKCAAAPGETWRKPIPSSTTSAAAPGETWLRLSGVEPVKVTTNENGCAAYITNTPEQQKALIAHLLSACSEAAASTALPIPASPAPSARAEDDGFTLVKPKEKSVKPTKLCDFYGKPSGCRNGDKCRFRHVDITPAAPAPSAPAAETESPTPTPVHSVSLEEVVGGSTEEAICRGEIPATHETAAAFAEAALTPIQAAIRAKYLEQNLRMVEVLPPLAPKPATPAESAEQVGGAIFARFLEMNPMFAGKTSPLVGLDPSALAGPIAALLRAALLTQQSE